MERESTPSALVPVSGIIFDLDGTLLDTVEDLAGSMNMVLEDWGHPTHTTQDYLRMIGHGATNLVARALPSHDQSEERIAEALILFRQDYQERWRENTKPYPGIADLLTEVSDLGLPMAVLSNKPHKETVRIVQEMLADWEFSAVIGQREEVPRKPDPTSALEIAAAMNLSPGQILLVGDTEADIETARRAGMPSVGVSWGFRPLQELIDAGADQTITSPGQLLSLLSPAA
jgi:phosphoglycolate phosphatase